MEALQQVTNTEKKMEAQKQSREDLDAISAVLSVNEEELNAYKLSRRSTTQSCAEWRRDDRAHVHGARRGGPDRRLGERGKRTVCVCVNLSQQYAISLLRFLTCSFVISKECLMNIFRTCSFRRAGTSDASYRLTMRNLCHFMELSA